MLIAVTSSDEINMVACQLAHTLFHTPTKISRVREHDYLVFKNKIFSDKSIPIDVLISPEQLVTDHVNRLLENQGTLEVVNFADDAAQLVSVRIPSECSLIGQESSYLSTLMPTAAACIVGIFRRGRPLLLTQKPLIEVGDEVFVIAATKDARSVVNKLGLGGRPHKKVMIAGGGNIGARLARVTQSRYQVKIIERDINRCNWLATQLQHTVVIHGNASDHKLLIGEGIDSIDFFCALTDNDETNIMTSMLTRRLGAGTVMTLINNPAYVNLIRGGVIDIAISPQQTTVGVILTHVRRGDVVNVHSLQHGSAEALEAIAHGDRSTSKVVGRTIGSIHLPAFATIGAVVRKRQFLMAHQDLVIEDEDHVIMFLTEKKRVNEVDRLFQVGLTFFR